MLSFKKYISEVAKPKSELDKKVFADHPIKKTDYPVSNNGVYDVKTKKDNSRKADQVNTTESEELSEISKERMLAYKDAAGKSFDKARDEYDSAKKPEQKKKAEDTIGKRNVGIWHVKSKLGV